jgi:putative intracellular protease/amidase
MTRPRPTDSITGVSRRNFLRTTAGATLACACLQDSAASLLPATLEAGAKAATYVCPPCGLPCDKLTFDAPGACPKCGMTLVAQDGGADAPPSVAILLFNGAQLIDFAGPWEVFGTAGFLVHTVAEKPEPLTAVFGAKIIPDFTFANSPRADVLLVPGGGVFEEAIKDMTLIRWIQAKGKEASVVVSVCTGAFLLQAAGLLNGHTVTTTYGMIEDLIGPETEVVYDRRFVDSGNLITTAGLSSGIDGALHVVSRLLGSGVAQSVALEMEYNWDPIGGYARAALADRFLPDGLAYSKPRIKGAQAKMISTVGNRDQWETKIVISEPHTVSKVLELVRARIGANTGTSGMFKPVAHIHGTPQVTTASGTQLTWKFTDDQRQNWKGRCAIEPYEHSENLFLVTFRLAQV